MNAITSSEFELHHMARVPIDPPTEVLERDAMPRPGSLVDGRYRLEGKIGAGGHATVYRATHVQLDRVVALKILSQPQRASERRRFRQEANLLARLEHPNLVRIFDFGFVNQRPYICMERLEGCDLATYIERRGPMHPRRALSLMMPALDALALAHDRHIVHKDLKPSNFFLQAPDSGHESLKVLDFGTARVADQRQTSSGNRSGTAQYLPPEYVENGSVSPASDVYQLAITLVEMLTGVAFIAESGIHALERHVRGELVLPRVLAEGPVGTVFRRALAADPTLRYSDAHAFKSALAEIEAHFDPSSPLDTGEPQEIDTHDLSAFALPSAHGTTLRQPDADRSLLVAIIAVLVVANAIIWLI